ncbi:MAG: Gfo/Idh/MocA family oxidoreductase [Bacteroidota bacterium]|nr:Gfo/Idh/MocA family oxidoreductase [Bacteroidota bacterium]
MDIFIPSPDSIPVHWFWFQALLVEESNLPMTLMHNITRLVAIADVDSERVQAGKEWTLNFYEEKTGKKNFVDISLYQDYHEMLQDPSTDAVIISTPDHWHAQPAIEAAGRVGYGANNLVQE